MTDDPKWPAGPGVPPLDAAAHGLDAIAKMQKDFIGNLEGMSQAWLSHTQATANLVNDLITQLWKSRSAPETMTAYQQFLSRRMEMMVEESRRFFATSEKFLDAGAKMLANGFPSAVEKTVEGIKTGKPESGGKEG
jgi:hypothetical protein